MGSAPVSSSASRRPLCFSYEHVPVLVVVDKTWLTQEIRPHSMTQGDLHESIRPATPLWGPGPGWLIPPALVVVAVKS